MMTLSFKWMKWFSFALLSLILILSVCLGVGLFTQSGLQLVLWGTEKVLPQLKVEQAQGALFRRFSLNKVTFVDETLHIDAKSERVTLAINARCLLDFRLCIDELTLQGVDLQMPELPQQESVKEEKPPTRRISTPVPILVNKVNFNDINLNILGNKLYWQEFSTALLMHGDRLAIAPTTMSTIKVSLADLKPNQTKAAASNTQATEHTREPIVLPEVWLPLKIKLQRLDINDFQLQGQTPVTVNHLGLEAEAAGDKVDIQTLELKMPEVEGQLSTQVTLSADYPITAQIDALIKQADAKGQKLALSASGSVADLSLQASLSDLASAKIQAHLQPLKAELPFDLTLDNVKAQWPLVGKSDYQVSLPNVVAKGSLNGYTLSLQGEASGKDFPAVDVNVKGAGNLEHIDLESIVIKTLGGELSGDVMVNWHAPLNWQADLNLAHIQPGLQWQDIEGNLNGQLNTSGSLTSQGGWQVSLPMLDIDGVLRGYPLNIKGQLEAADKTGKTENIHLNTQGLTLSHGPNLLQVTGKVDNDILMDLEVKFPDIAKTVPDLAGSVTGSIAVRGNVKQPQAELDISLTKLKWQEQLNIASAALTGSVAPYPKPKADVNLVVKDILYGGQHIQRTDVSLSGNEQSHQLVWNVTSEKLASHVEIEGSLKQKPQLIWDGSIQRLALSTPQGPWALQKPTQITANIDKQLVDVQANCWLQAESKICLTQDVTLGKTGEVSLAISDFDFDQVDNFLPKETQLYGKLAADINAKWAPDTKPELNAIITLPQGKAVQTLDKPITLNWNKMNLEAKLAQDKLMTQWLVDITDNGDLSGDLVINNVSTDEATLDGQVSLSTFSLDFLSPLLGEFSEMKASLDSDLALSGDIMHPEVNGHVTLNQLKLQGEVTPVDINSGQVVLDFKGHQAELNADILTPDGKLIVDGAADWQDLNDWHSSAHVFAKELKVDLSPMGKAMVEPDMTIHLQPNLAKIDGKIHLPWGRLFIDELPPSAVKVSSDTVILNANVRPLDDGAKLPFKVVTDVDINIGDDFQFSAFGLEGNLQGKLNVTQKDKGPFIVGEVNIIDGSYRSFGQDLQIEKGKILMNGPADEPYIAIRAIRNPNNTQDDVIAGVDVTGPASDPKIEVFSQPAMSQANALSYLLRGQKLDAESGDNAMTTALIGLSLAQSGQVVGQIGEAFGVEDLQLDTAGSGDDSQVTVSGYILPGLQVKYGVGIFNSLGEFTVRYRLLKDLYIEAVSGVDSAVDFLYQFEFN
ncbi:hypothetical protein BS333_01695 [Vibrio azureus]|uniref:Translocation and assembly module TamB C-terminal domain-containing protein n=1 Tax=Vibrio azureus NBRC 104587 TaxID=1219077 RepID=U3AQT2_9VIBR|nr:translocation/assembly module TamB domain-containing protein [Vibrio azureus]AUI85203.1 hypothetical protein BS333_01695 [Vibrio azureus]GAD75642.1 hypothetical protein VAZ01S_027_00700 [Vibrio azureus NBRC 104587]